MSPRAPLSALRAERSREVAQRIAVFGTGPIERVYRIGPHPQLLGRSVSTLDVRPSAGEGVHLSGRELLADVDLSLDVLPSYITGALTGRHADRQPLRSVAAADRKSWPQVLLRGGALHEGPHCQG